MRKKKKGGKEKNQTTQSRGKKKPNKTPKNHEQHLLLCWRVIGSCRELPSPANSKDHALHITYVIASSHTLQPAFSKKEASIPLSSKGP